MPKTTDMTEYQRKRYRRSVGVPEELMDRPAYDPDLRLRRTYRVGNEDLTMKEVLTKYGAHMRSRILAGETGKRMMRPKGAR